MFASNHSSENQVDPWAIIENRMCREACTESNDAEPSHAIQVLVGRSVISTQDPQISKWCITNSSSTESSRKVQLEVQRSLGAERSADASKETTLFGVCPRNSSNNIQAHVCGYVSPSGQRQLQVQRSLGAERSADLSHEPMFGLRLHNTFSVMKIGLINDKPFPGNFN
jgi:hypothetical protein